MLTPRPHLHLYQDTKYSFTMKPKAPDMFELALPSSGQVLEVSTREQADGSLYISYGAEIHQARAIPPYRHGHRGATPEAPIIRPRV